MKKLFAILTLFAVCTLANASPPFQNHLKKETVSSCHAFATVNIDSIYDVAIPETVYAKDAVEVLPAIFVARPYEVAAGYSQRARSLIRRCIDAKSKETQPLIYPFKHEDPGINTSPSDI